MPASVRSMRKRASRAAMRAVAVVLPVVLALGAPAVLAADADVLLVFSNNRLLPANVEADRGFSERATGSRAPDLRIFAEFLGAPTFSGDDYENTTASYLREKYRSKDIRVLVAAGYSALDFLLKHRAAMFPAVPIVFCCVDKPFLDGRALPDDLLGVPVEYDIEGTIGLALALQPKARRLVLVAGRSGWDRDREAGMREAVPRLSRQVPTEFLVGLPTDALIARLRALEPDTIVYTPGFFDDGAGKTYTPAESVALMARESAAPIYTPYSSQLGLGIVGGRMTSYVEMGRSARRIVDLLVAGESVTKASIPSSLPRPPQLDWRQVTRRGIDPDLVPADAVIHFREPSFWEAYRTHAIVALVVFLVQAALIAALLFQRRVRRRTAAALEASERHMQLAARAARLSMFDWDLARDRAWSDPRLREPAGLSRDPPERFEDVLATIHPHDRERVERTLRHAVVRADGEVDVEYRSVSADGEPRWFALRGHVPPGQPHGIAGVKMDVTARKKAEMQAAADRATLTHLARISTMGQLSAAIAHQLNQPLAAILGNAETARKMLGRPGTSTEELGEILDDIVAEDHRAADVIRRLGALYRRGETELVPVDANELVRETLDLVRAELTMRQVSADVDLAPSLPRVPGSRVQLQQVLLNLLLNAADAMAGVETPRRTITVRTSADASGVRVCVADRGTGIAPADLPRMFDPFWTTKPHGIGVGLAICQAIVSAHRGTLVAANAPEGGAVVCFTLPRGADGA